MPKSLVTGGCGFIGSHIVDLLLSKGHEVIVLDDQSADNENFYFRKEADYFKVDITEPDTDIYYRDVDYVFHLAAESRLQKSITSPINTAYNNFMGTAMVLENSRKGGVKKVIYSSTSSAYGMSPGPNDESHKTDCLNPYAATKVAAEELCKLYTKLYNLDTVIFRYFNVYGERSPSNGQYLPVVGVFLRQYKDGEPLTIVGDGSQRRDFVHVKDVAKANIMAIEKDLKTYYGQVFNIGTGNNISVKEIADIISENQIYISERPAEAKSTLANIAKVKNILGWTPQIDIKKWIMENK